MKSNVVSIRSFRVKQFLRKQKLNILLLAAIAVVCSVYISRKEGYHMDELLSFELANAEFTPWIVTTQPVGRLEKFMQNEIYGDSFGETCANLMDTVKDVLENKGNSKLLSYRADVYEEPVWISAEQFRAYITTEGRDRFCYPSVYFNVKDDNHPPLHFMAVHTVSSLFPGKINPWMGCSINLLLMLGSCILLMRICQEIFESEKLGRAVCILYACSMAGIATLLLIRMYAMLTFFCLAVLWLHLKKQKTGDWKTKNKLLIFLTVCGFLTQYYFVIFMIFLAGTTLVLLAGEKDKKSLLCYLRSMGIAAVIGLCIYPFSIADVLYSGRGIESVQNLGSGFSNLGERFLAFFRIFGEQSLGGMAGAGILLIFCVAAVFVRLFMEKTAVKSMKKAEPDLKAYYKMAGIPCIGYFLIVVKIAPYYADRYMMPVFPLAALFIGLLLQKIVRILAGSMEFFGRRGILLSLSVLLVLPGILTVTPEYLYQGYAGQEHMSEEYCDTACLCVYEGVGYYQNLVEFTNYKETLLVTQEELLNRSHDSKLEKEDKLVVLLKNNVDGAAVGAYLSEHYGYRRSGFLLRGSAHQDTLCLYEK